MRDDGWRCVTYVLRNHYEINESENCLAAAYCSSPSYLFGGTMVLQNAGYFLLAALAWLVFSYLFISIGEHQIHKHFMHKKQLFAWLYKIFPYLKAVFEAHAVRHHSIWYKDFDFE